MPKFRITVDVPEGFDDQSARALVTEGFIGRMGGEVVGIDELTDGDETEYPRAIIFRRRATSNADTPGDFLPNTQPCEWELDGGCNELAFALVSYSDGQEARYCLTHIEDAARWTETGEPRG